MWFPTQRSHLGVFSASLWARSGKLIGRGGENIKKLIETSGVDGIDVDDSGNVAITGQAKAVATAESLIKEMFIKPEVGQVYPGSLVKKVKGGSSIGTGRNLHSVSCSPLLVNLCGYVST